MLHAMNPIVEINFRGWSGKKQTSFFIHSPNRKLSYWIVQITNFFSCRSKRFNIVFLNFLSLKAGERAKRSRILVLLDFRIDSIPATTGKKKRNGWFRWCFTASSLELLYIGVQNVNPKRKKNRRNIIWFLFLHFGCSADDKSAASIRFKGVRQNREKT